MRLACIYKKCKGLMDFSLASGAVGGVSIGGVLGLIYTVYKLVNHTECRSRCCGRTFDAALDVNATPVASHSVAATAPVSASAHVSIPVLSSTRSIVSTRVRPPLHPIQVHEPHPPTPMRKTNSPASVASRSSPTDVDMYRFN